MLRTIKIAAVTAICCWAFSQWATGQLPTSRKPAPEPAKETRSDDPQAAEKLAFFRDRFARCRLIVDDRPNEPCKLVPEPPIKFDNPISQIYDGFLFAWTDRGRPVAVVKSYHNLPNKTWGRTFVSVAPRPLEMHEGAGPLWTPQEAGVTFGPLANEKPPAADARVRLGQMRQIARRFQVVDRWGIKDPTDWQLRLLSTPLLRYEAPDEDVLEGGMFGYVLTNAPEALVFVEARKANDGLEWFYAVSRCTRFEIRVSLDGKQIAEFPRLEAWPATGTYFHSPLPWENYPCEP
jgi:hypothetical protein